MMIMFTLHRHGMSMAMPWSEKHSTIYIYQLYEFVFFKKKKKLYEFVLLCMQCHIKSNKFRVLEIKSNKLPVDCSVIQ